MWVLLLLVLLHHTASKVMQFVWVLLLLVLLHHTVSKISRCRTTQCMHRITESNYNQCKIFNHRIYKCQTCARVGIRYRGNLVSDVCYNCVYAANWVNFPFLYSSFTPSRNWPTFWSNKRFFIKVKLTLVISNPWHTK